MATNSTLDFDEFRALTKRQRAKVVATPTNAAAGKAEPEPVIEKKSNNIIVNAFRTSVDLATRIVENNELQALYLTLLLIDTFCSFALVIIAFGMNYAQSSTAADSGYTENQLASTSIITQLFVYMTTLEGGYSSPYIGLLVPVLHSIAAVCLSLELGEILLVLYAFRLRVFTHAGYLVDYLVLCTQLCEQLGLVPSLISITLTNSSTTPTPGSSTVLSIVAYGVSWRVLNWVRCWRFVRLYSAFQAVEAGRHQVTRLALEDKGMGVCVCVRMLCM